MKRVVLIYSLFLCSLDALAQRDKGALSGKIVDSATREPISLATVTVFRAADTTIVTYRLSNPDGEFKIPALPHGINYRVIISVSGYQTFRKEFQLQAASPDLDLGTVDLAQNVSMLEEVIVVAERPPVIVRNDTIEFNASSFKTLPAALVEDLLRKLPGVQIDRSGEVTVNGRRVNRILVDGKTFFGDDPKMATRNLPANFIDKVQVTDDKEEIARSVDGDLSNIGKVINLTLKKGVKKGWFGKAYGGGGTKERYEAGAIANIFRDTLQLSLIAFSNNVNRSGFSMKDVQELGGFGRSGMNGIMVRSNAGTSGFGINNVSFGGMENGISTSTGAGFNLNHAPNAKESFFVQYFFGEGKQDLQETTNREQFIADTILRTINTSRTFKISTSHAVSAGMKLKPDSLTNLDFNASFSAVGTNNPTKTFASTESNKDGTLSTGTGDRYNDGTNSSYNHSLTYQKISRKKKGRTFMGSHQFRYNKNVQSIITEQTNIFQLPVADSVMFAQLRAERMPNLQASATATAVEPLSKAFSVRLFEQVEFLKDEQAINTFNRDASGKYAELNQLLTNGFTRQQFRSSTTANISYKLKRLTLTVGANALWQDVQNRFDKSSADINMSLLNMLPNFSVTWKDLFVSYSENITVPQITYLNPVVDNSDPLFVREANPYLKPKREKSVHGSYHLLVPRSNLSLMWFTNGSIADNDVILARSVDERGVQVSRPVNVNGTRYLQSAVFVSQQLKNDTKFSFSVKSTLWVNFSRQALLVNGISGTMRAFSVMPSAVLSFNWNDVIEFRPEYNLNINRTRYTVTSFPNLYVPTHSAGTELIVRWPKKIVWETNIFYRHNSQVSPGMPKSNTLWNAGINYSILKGDRGLIRLSVYDILNSNQDFWRQATENYVLDRRTNILQRYFLLTFTYNIQTTGAKNKIGGRERLFWF